MGELVGLFVGLADGLAVPLVGLGVTGVGGGASKHQLPLQGPSHCP